MSGDVQPRKRKDKKRKKDELSLEEPKGTAAALGEGDVFMHSYQDHGTGGHWCAKIIFFSLLAVLITLIGLIILENRGLSELEANAVESRYSGVLEGWIEDAPDDDHHDEHTLDLKHQDDDHNDVQDQDNQHDDEHDDENDDIDDEDNEEDSEENNENADSHEDEHNEDREQELNSAQDEDEDNNGPYKGYYINNDYDDDEPQNGREDDEDDEDDNELQNNDDENMIHEHANKNAKYGEANENYFASNDDENDFEEDGEQNENQYDFDDDVADKDEDDRLDEQDEDEHEDEEGKETKVEVEKIERESEEEPISTELPPLPEDDDNDQDDDTAEDDSPDDGEDDDNDDDGEDEEFLEADDEPPVVERITAPAGKPFKEVEENEDSTEKPLNTLEEEEEYEKQQEDLRREEEQASHMWLKLAVGGALLAATHAVLRRATAPSNIPEDEVEEGTEETTAIDRRMTLIPEEPTEPEVPKRVAKISKPIVEEVKKLSSAVRFACSPPPKQESEDEEIEEIDEDVDDKSEEDKELFSDEDVKDKIVQKKEIPDQQLSKQPETKIEDDEEVSEDVEIIDEEQIEEEIEEEDEEDISDVDDAELLTRLEAKYGRLPEPERPLGHRFPQEGGNSIEDEWPGEPTDPFWRQQLDSAEQQLRQGSWLAAVERASSPELNSSGRARYIAAKALDRAAEQRRDNVLLGRAIAAYLSLLKMNEKLSNKKLLKITARTIDRIQFRGNYLNAEPVYRLLIHRFPDDPAYRNNLSISFLMANRADLAEDVLKETLVRWPNDKVALAHYGFVLKTQHHKYEEAVKYISKALEGDEGPACEPRFYYNLGDALLLLGRYAEANEVHKRAAKLGHFLSPSQRSLYNVPRLKSKPWWSVEETPYIKLARALENSWKDILKEGEAAKTLYEKEKEGLKERGEWSQLDLFARGREIQGRCKNAPVTCAIVKTEVAAVGCRRGQIKFSAMEPGTHVRPHVGPTNCRLRMHLGLSNTKDTYLRVDQITKQWQEGKVLIFDDSFEHEVWHNGTGARLVLIVDVWHPDLTPAEKTKLPAI